MQLHITGLRGMISEFVPTVQSHVIQIKSGGSDSYEAEFYRRAVVHPLYVSKGTYVFDDVFPGIDLDNYMVLMTSEVAKTIISDFMVACDAGIEGLVVHCSRGVNRSPAVGMALNRMFDFGYDHEILLMKYPAKNMFVYKTLLEAGKELGIGPGFDSEFERKYAAKSAAASLRIQGVR